MKNTGFSVYKLPQDVKWKFIVSFILIFFTSLSILSTVGIVPENNKEDENRAIVKPVLASEEEYVNPVRIIIDSVGIDSVILNPESNNISVLDEALRSGVVHYPGSGLLSDTSNMFLFGHSSHLPIVYNPAYQLFNNLEKVQVGADIVIRSESHKYIYRVSKVSLVDAKEALVELSDKKKMLTLSTCNSFGETSERYVVEADFVRSYPLES